MSEKVSGYKSTFLGRGHSLKLPVLNSRQKKDLVKFGADNHVLDYIHYSAVMSKTRRFAYFTAVNIDGSLWHDNPRKGKWARDKRIGSDEQYGRELYGAVKSDFDQGHLVRREDPEWGDKTVAVEAGENTFRYPNCVPQHKKLNQEIWAELEANILHKGASDRKMKISVFTGPVLSDNDGIFITRVKETEVRIPNLFWKVVTWVKSDGKTYAVGFVQSQEKFLVEGGIIKKYFIPGKRKMKQLTDEDIFEHLKFKDGKTYQVRIEEIEGLTGLKFDWPGVVRPFTNPVPKQIKCRKVISSSEPAHSGKRLAARKMRLNLDGMVLS